MKKTWIILLFGWMSFLTALPVGNPSEASMLKEGVFWSGSCSDICDPSLSICDAWSIRVGFYGDYVWNRHLKVNTRGRHDIIEKVRLSTNAAYFAFNLYDRIDLFGTAGLSNFSIATNRAAVLFPLSEGSTFILETTTNFSWSIGTRATLWQCGCTTLGGEFQYFSMNPNVEQVRNFEAIILFPSNVKLKYWEWQVALALSQRIGMVVPYVGVAWSGAKANFDRVQLPPPSSNTLFDLNNQRLWGWVIGSSFIGCERVVFTVEGRFASEKALYVNGQVRF